MEVHLNTMVGQVVHHQVATDLVAWVVHHQDTVAVTSPWAGHQCLASLLNNP